MIPDAPNPASNSGKNLAWSPDITLTGNKPKASFSGNN